MATGEKRAKSPWAIRGTMTVDDVIKLREARHSAAVYPRKEIVVVDGFKRYALVGKWPKGLPLA